ncbi:alpha/beta fold hydrolase [Actinomadura macrotermitis]|uniref:Tripeptidyl aminopeptidase n=1 Tax=Actinomadura macrotermitis TaxID=2585200 RepID=A0A7K0C610_9ACTN|nr:alpha/beta fold hydrolase [Actinomadura macrotermitis]MQY08532.1 Tripeptidyl aminopeptidase [Actinomadura macrotermitis]
MIRVVPAVALAVGLAAASVAAAHAARGEEGLGRFEHQRITWKGCALGPGDETGTELDKAGARCADVTVPLDYAAPGGRTVTIAVSRLAATDRAHRIGTMIVNGGGPGPAIDMPPYIKALMGKAGARYDLVGMDPRSTGRSVPVDCGWPSGHWVRSAGTTRASFERGVAFARDLAARCAARHADVLPHISTRNAARDMDVIRAALGERRVSYNGASYGTYLGAVYAQMFPGRLDRVVLDSAVDPDKWSPRLLHGTEGANERALAHWADWAARRDSAYHLGRSRAAVLATVRRVIEASARTPLRVGPYRADDTITPVVLFNLLQNDQDGPRAELASAVTGMARAARGEHVPATGPLGDTLAFLLTGAESRYGSAQTALLCGDAAAPRDPQVYWRDVRKARRVHPFFGGIGANINPCAFWPTAPRERPTKVATTLPSIVVGATGDTRTVYPASQALHRLLKGSRMVTLRGADVHAPYQAGYGDACVNAQVNGYLATGRRPARDVVCG